MLASVGERAGHPDRAGDVQLVGIEDDLRLQGGRRRSRPKAMRLDGMRHRIHERGRMAGQDLARPRRGRQVMVGSIPALGDIVEQRGRADNRQIGPLGRGDALGQCRYAQHVGEVVAAAGVAV